jgi:hypothetical protein
MSLHVVDCNMTLVGVCSYSCSCLALRDKTKVLAAYWTIAQFQILGGKLG